MFLIMVLVVLLMFSFAFFSLSVKMNFRRIRKYGRFCEIPDCKYHNKPKKRDKIKIQFFPAVYVKSSIDYNEDGTRSFNICEDCKQVVFHYTQLRGSK
jgi:hypothetical protein